VKREPGGAKGRSVLPEYEFSPSAPWGGRKEEGKRRKREGGEKMVQKGWALLGIWQVGPWPAPHVNLKRGGH